MTSERPESREAGESVEEPILAWSPRHRSLLSSHWARLTQEWSHYTSWFLLIIVVLLLHDYGLIFITVRIGLEIVLAPPVLISISIH